MAELMAHLLTSVTRFGKISPLGQTLKNLSELFRVYFLFGKILNLLWQCISILAKFELL